MSPLLEILAPVCAYAVEQVLQSQFGVLGMLLLGGGAAFWRSSVRRSASWAGVAAVLVLLAFSQA
ncbi:MULTISPECIES: hypothetical protein [unclassified Streptomyces]|uniref:hypothetical protein n=1 Tax=unclassified Streptomyces TaxID=2593676 RepID=UPI000DC42B17|nr:MULTISPECIES: hypothetical protein [unclassified Streptomyces]MYT72295.1 hypothetical protein [Streptomyces sp. SID8367]RAJ81710.1 hypothetical protein K377_04731 [Streptomyces sp. PsTaAH-137]